MSNYIPRFYVDVIIYPYPNHKTGLDNSLSKGVTIRLHKVIIFQSGHGPSQVRQ